MAVRFDAVGESYNRSATGISTGSFTMICWVRISTDTNAVVNVLGMDAGASYSKIGFDSTGTGFLWFTDSGDINPAASLSLSTWYFVAATYNSGGTDTLYWGAANAASLTTATGSISGASDSHTLYIGNDAGGARLNGRVAAVAVWTAALTADELDNERWFIAPQRTNDLWAWYPFDSYLDGADYSGNGRTLTAAGTVSGEDGPPISWSRPAKLWVPAFTGAATATPAVVTVTADVPAPTVTVPSGGGIEFSDTFTYADNASLATASGGNWLDVGGTAVWSVVSGEARYRKAASGFVQRITLTNTNMSSADHYAEADIRLTTFTNVNVGICIRGAVATDGSCIEAMLDGTQFRIRSRTNGTATSLINTAHGLTAPFTATLRIEASGNDIHAEINGGTVTLDYTTSTHNTNLKAGLLGISQFDSSCFADNFEAGTAGGGGTPATATPAVVTVSTSVPAPTVSAVSNAAATPAVVTVTTSVPAPTVTTAGNAEATPSVVTVTANVPAPTATASTSATPAAVTVTASVPAPTATASTSATPAVVTVSATVPAPAISAGANANATPNIITVTTSVPAPAVAAGANASVTPNVVTVSTSVPAPTATASSSATPAVVTASTSVPAPTVETAGNASTTPDVITRTTNVPAPTVAVGSRATPSVVTVTANVPTPGVSAGSDVTVTASVVTVTASALAVTASATSSVTVTAAVVTKTASVLSPTIRYGQTVSASVVTITAGALAAILGDIRPTVTGQFILIDTSPQRSLTDASPQRSVSDVSPPRSI